MATLTALGLNQVRLLGSRQVQSCSVRCGVGSDSKTRPDPTSIKNYGYFGINQIFKELLKEPFSPGSKQRHQRRGERG